MRTAIGWGDRSEDGDSVPALIGHVIVQVQQDLGNKQHTYLDKVAPQKHQRIEMYITLRLRNERHYKYHMQNTTAFNHKVLEY